MVAQENSCLSATLKSLKLVLASAMLFVAAGFFVNAHALTSVEYCIAGSLDCTGGAPEPVAFSPMDSPTDTNVCIARKDRSTFLEARTACDIAVGTNYNHGVLRPCNDDDACDVCETDSETAYMCLGVGG